MRKQCLTRCAGHPLFKKSRFPIGKPAFSLRYSISVCVLQYCRIFKSRRLNYSAASVEAVSVASVEAVSVASVEPVSVSVAASVVGSTDSVAASVEASTEDSASLDSATLDSTVASTEDSTALDSTGAAASLEPHATISADVITAAVKTATNFFFIINSPPNRNIQPYMRLHLYYENENNTFL